MPGSLGEKTKAATGSPDVPTTTDFDREPFEPPVSVTVSVTENVPASRYWCEAVRPVPLLPSPKSHE